MNDEHAQWVQARESAVWAPHGTASLAATCWLDDTDRAFEGLPGRWRADGSVVRGSGLPGRQRLESGEEVRLGELLLRAEVREDALLLRVFDPSAADRKGISTIVRAPYDSAGVRGGMYSPTSEHHGIVVLEVDGGALELDVAREPDGTLFAAFSDSTSGEESYLFRFLRLPAPDSSGRVEVDLNRAYLPPCAFSEHYLCVFPPPRNRWSVPVCTGELRVQ